MHNSWIYYRSSMDWMPGYWLFPILTLSGIFFIIVAFLKAYALWHAAKRDELGWFVAMLFINTLGILEVVYLLKRGLLKKIER